jgi:hypothetical protein
MPVGAELLYANNRTDRHDDANNCFSLMFCGNSSLRLALKYIMKYLFIAICLFMCLCVVYLPTCQ